MGPRNTLGDLNDHLFETLERLTDDDLDEDALRREIARSKAVCAVSSQIISSGHLMVSAQELRRESKTDGVSVPRLLEGRSDG
jgi:hypothetical protein